MFQCITIQHIARLKEQPQQHKSHPRSKFTPEEDAELIRLVDAKGENDWQAIANEMPSRTVRQCKERWLNYLSPSLDKSPWKEAEDKLLNEKYRELGSRWRLIAQSFPNRTEIAVKNRMKKLLRKQAKNERFMNDLMNSLKNSSNPANIALLASAIATQNKIMAASSSGSQSDAEAEQKEVKQKEIPVNIQELSSDFLENTIFTDDLLAQEPMEWKQESLFTWDSFNEFEI